MPKTNENTAGGAERSCPFLFWLPLIAVVVAASLLSGCAAQSSQQESRQSAEEQTRESQAGGSGGDGEQATRSELGPPALGDAGAPVVMAEYGDFQ